MDNVKKTERVYGFLWGINKMKFPVHEWHFDKMQEVISEPIVRGSIGVDIGSGGGYDTYIMARNNPPVKIISMDLSNGIYRAKQITSGLHNVETVKGDALAMPFKNGIFDFAYSFGVLHHTFDPKRGLREIFRVLKTGGPVFLYLYEDHSGNALKRIAVMIISLLRYATTRIPAGFVYFLSWMFSPLVFIIFTIPAKIFGKFKVTRSFASKIPFNFAKSFFSLSADLYDRFSVPIEHRCNRQEVYQLFAECGFSRINISQLNNIAGWVAWGYKDNA